jgi:hypothetical protein
VLPSPHPRVLSRRLGDELVLVHLDTNQIYTLSATGGRFWELLSESRDRERVEASLRAEFDVSGEEIGAEIDRLLVDLERLDLVR